MVKLSDLEVSPEKIDEGEWYDLATKEPVGDDRPDGKVYIKVGSKMSERWRRALVEACRDLDDGVADLPQEVSNRVDSEELFLGIEGIEDDEGNPIEDSAALRFKILSDPRHEVIRRTVNELGSADEVRIRKAAAGIQKN